MADRITEQSSKIDFKAIQDTFMQAKTSGEELKALAQLPREELGLRLRADKMLSNMPQGAESGPEQSRYAYYTVNMAFLEGMRCLRGLAVQEKMSIAVQNRIQQMLEGWKADGVIDPEAVEHYKKVFGISS